ncbi:hypothetical protein [Microvirga sp. VF16]|uniref:hypothetical protein n=1 Tax=Microvirga sp. VF16 TaxID=2807101 RepID=UPI00193D897C|nr:hypothetical protein [Microvirga sp. VF16]QRM34754.1 hypothetical protein JO965_41560 [Microvirga sp. VF16]
MTGHLPRTLHHATPLYRYDPQATDNHGVWDSSIHGQIRSYGLSPCMHSSKDVPIVFLTDELGLATNYAECNRGEEWPVDWIILAIDSSIIDRALLLPDMDQEAQTMADDILAQGYTQAEWDAGLISWFPLLKITGQVRYSAAIPHIAITPFKILPVDPSSR